MPGQGGGAGRRSGVACAGIFVSSAVPFFDAFWQAFQFYARFTICALI